MQKWQVLLSFLDQLQLPVDRLTWKLGKEQAQSGALGSLWAPGLGLT